jgi:hypothetical protein
MAVDYFHRLIIHGPRPKLVDLRRRLTRTWSRRSGRRTRTGQLPFSFAALYDIAPAASRVEREVPGEPYDVRVWPIAQGDRGPAELRYQLHTREIDLFGFLRPLSRACPSLTLVLSTLYLDDGEFASFHARRGKLKRWFLPPRRHEVHWERARRKFRLAGDDVYDDDYATFYAEEGMNDEALAHWERPATLHGRRRRRQWWNRPVARDFETERELDFIEISKVLRSETKRDAASAVRAAPTRKKGTD